MVKSLFSGLTVAAALMLGAAEAQAQRACSSYDFDAATCNSQYGCYYDFSYRVCQSSGLGGGNGGGYPGGGYPGGPSNNSQYSQCQYQTSPIACDRNAGCEWDYRGNFCYSEFGNNNPYPGNPYPGNPHDPHNPYPGNPGNPHDPHNPYPGNPGNPYPGNPHDPNNPYPGNPNNPNNPYPGNPNNPYPGNPNNPNNPYPGNPNQGQQTTQITCTSRGQQQSQCPVQGRVIAAQVVYDQSNGRCRQGNSWGTTAYGVWVSNGCSAVFSVTYQR